MNVFEAVLGLEIHAQLMTHSKIFCGASTKFGAAENSQLNPPSAGLPGALPVLNLEVVKLGIRAGLALNCTINQKSQFARKHYFYPDLPKGYQISQFDKPLCTNGFIEILSQDKFKKIGIERIHLEEDAGKSTHLSHSTLVNLNRAGVPLIEIVSRPDIRSPQEAAAYMKEIYSALLFAKVCDGNLEEGNFRCDVNISIRPLGSKTLGTRTELKNLNSFRFVEKASEYEIARQIALVSAGGHVIQETRGWDAAANKTYTLRKKEEAHDYRYFPDPDLPPLQFDSSFVSHELKSMPELPQIKRARYQNEFELSVQDALLLTSNIELAMYFEKVIKENVNPKLAANWISSELLGELKRNGLEPAQCPFSEKHFAKLLKLIETGTLSAKMAKRVFYDIFLNNEDPDLYSKNKGLIQVQDNAQIESWVKNVLSKNPEQVLAYKSGNLKLVDFFVGQIMKLSFGKANPASLREILLDYLKKDSQ